MSPYARFLAAALVLGLLAAPVQARTIYEVEVIVFEHLDTPGTSEERWRPGVTVPRFDRTVAFEADDPVGGAFVAPLPDDFGLLEAEGLRLTERRRQLEQSSRFRVLRHLGWHQPALDPDEAVSVRIKAGEPMDVRVPVGDEGPFGGPARIEEILSRARTDSLAGAATSAQDGAEQQPAIESGAAHSDYRALRVYPLDGSVRVVVRRYLHLYADLYFTTPVQWDELRTDVVRSEIEPLPLAAQLPGDAGMAAAGMAQLPETAIGPDGEAVLSYPLRQHRRMRSRELHYLDHPVVGLLIQVVPREAD